MSFFNLLTTTQAAELLGVTPGRVRQMVTEGKLKPLPLPGRESRFPRDRVERLAVQQRLGRTRLEKGETFTSPSLADVPPMQRTLVYDRIVQMPRHTRGLTVDAHLRIWTGEDGWAVVLIGTPATIGHGHLQRGRAELVTEEILQLYPTLDLRRTAIAELLPGHGTSGEGWELFDVVLDVDLAAGGSPFRESMRSFCEFDELVEAIGEQPVLWHREFYTPDEIERYQRLGRPLRKVLDPLGLVERDEQIRALEQSSHEFSELALDVLAVPARMVSENHAAIIPLPGADLDNLRYPWPPQGSFLEAATLPESVRELARTRGRKMDRLFEEEYQIFRERERGALDREDYSPTPFSSGRVAQHRAELITLAEDTEDGREGTDPVIHAAALAAMANLPYATVPNLAAWAELCETMPYPSRQTLHWTAADDDPVVSEYLAAALRDGGRDLKPHERQALERFGDQFGRDIEGTSLAVRSGEDGSLRVTVLAPLRAQNKLRRGDELVSARITIGHVPLFVRRDGGIIGTVPSPSRAAQMNYGYGGGGPGSAQHAILQHLAQSDLEVDDAARRAVERFTEDPRWAEGTNARAQVSDLLDGTYTAGKRPA